MGVFGNGFQHGDVTFGVRGTILVSHIEKGIQIVPNRNISRIAWPNWMKFGILGGFGDGFQYADGC
jgi:hypothetical protein